MTTTLDRDRFAAELEAAWRPLWCIAAAIVRDPSRADDVLQDAAVIALRKLDQFQPGTSFVAWMATIVRYVAMNAHRRGRRHAAAPLEQAAVERRDAPGAARGHGITGRGELVADQHDFDDRVVAALDRLDETARSCLLLRTVAQLSYREIALALDVPEGTAMSHVFRARRALRDDLADVAPAGAPTP